MDLGYTVAGALVGFIVGLTGVGGGALMTPLLVLLFGVSPAVAIGTDLLYAALTKSAGVLIHGLKGSVQWRIMRRLAAGSVPAAVMTLLALRGVDVHGSGFQHFLSALLGVMLVLTSLVLFAKPRWQAWAQSEPLDPLRRRLRRWRAPATVLAGALLGVLVTLSSIGAGALGAAILFMLYPRMPAVRVVGTDLAHAVPLTAVAGLGHLQLGTVDFTVLGALLLGSLPGIYFGSHLGLRLPERVMRPILAGMLLLIGLRFVL